MITGPLEAVLGLVAGVALIGLIATALYLAADSIALILIDLAEELSQ